MAGLPTLSPYIVLTAAQAASRASADAAASPAASSHPVKMPRIIYGTAWKKQRTKELCIMALREGFRGFDTACQPKHYNQKGLGEALSEAFSHMNIDREQLYIQTKYTPVGGQDRKTIPYDPSLPVQEQVLHSIQVSLRELGVSYIDAVLLHSPLDTPQETLDAWRGLEAAVERGHVRALGISNCYCLQDLQHLHAAASIKPVIVQNRFYPATGYDASLRAWCCKNGIVYQGFWTLTANPHVLRDPIITHSARRLKCTPEQLWFRYLMERDIVPLTGTTDQEHMQQDFSCIDVELPPVVCEQLDASLPRA
ncbi:uncharacterized protein LOC34617874 [Cyclospora cayetanensis]|uniref:Uncharacterized protein LOC34617874 n=2 Tax=Cyclospora cayetanensis TaxID=88456 RepID=A0A6P5WCF4_9EIME|nr:uncharacterized protein LOC34617874 [Cyclospora cayetanensis]OEH75037.1 aldo keto reductase family protein [Cyclospora cayetanensis]